MSLLALGKRSLLSRCSVTKEVGEDPLEFLLIVDGVEVMRVFWYRGVEGPQNVGGRGDYIDAAAEADGDAEVSVERYGVFGRQQTSQHPGHVTSGGGGVEGPISGALVPPIEKGEDHDEDGSHDN